MPGLLKSLSPLAHPLGLLWLALLGHAVFAAFHRRWLRAFLSALPAAALWLLSQPALVEPFYRQLESPWWQSTLEQAPDADAVVVLGGGWRASAREPWRVDLTDTADRLVTGIELCRRRRAPVLVLGGDSVDAGPEGPPESAGIRQWLATWNLAPAEILTLGRVRTTRDEAMRTRDLVSSRGWKRILLVTSASHMRRARATFEKAGVAVAPVACDFRYSRHGAASRAWKAFPEDEALAQLGTWWHEQVGWWAYQCLGNL